MIVQYHWCRYDAATVLMPLPPLCCCCDTDTVTSAAAIMILLLLLPWCLHSWKTAAADVIPTPRPLLLPWFRRCHCLWCRYDTADTSAAAMIPLHLEYSSLSPGEGFWSALSRSSQQMYWVIPWRTQVTALNTKLLPAAPPIGWRHTRDRMGCPFIPDSINSTPTSICHGWGWRLNVLIDLGMKRAVYWLIGGALEDMGIILLESPHSNMLCDGCSFYAIHVQNHFTGFLHKTRYKTKRKEMSWRRKYWFEPFSFRSKSLLDLNEGLLIDPKNRSAFSSSQQKINFKIGFKCFQRFSTESNCKLEQMHLFTFTMLMWLSKRVHPKKSSLWA